MEKIRTVVTGMGIISSIGKNIPAFERALRNGRSGIGALTPVDEVPIAVSIGAPVYDFRLDELLKQYENRGLPANFIPKAMMCAYDAPLGVQVSVVAALEAWVQAGLHHKPVNPQRIGIVVGGSNLSQDYPYSLLSKFRENPRFLAHKYPIHYMDTDHVGTVSEIFGIQGEGLTVGGASASGNVAVIKGFQAIQLGLVDVCFVLGALAGLSPLELQGYCNVGALGGKRFRDQPGKACRPFDKDHEGFIYGQAGGCLVLESFESAGKRGAPILAEILGGALTLDANRLPNPNEDGEVRVMETALAQAGLEARQVDYLNAHGTSSPLGDETEIKAVKRVFREEISRLWINSTKSLTGHCLTSAGLVESIAVIIQLCAGFLHPNLNLENPIDRVPRFCPGEAVKAAIDIAMNNSFGFGGFNTCVILKKFKT